MVGLLAEHAQQGAQALGAEPRGYELIVRWDRAMCSFLGSPYCGHPPEILITTALTITPGLLQRGRARESAEIQIKERKRQANPRLQRGRARESAEIPPALHRPQRLQLLQRGRARESAEISNRASQCLLQLSSLQRGRARESAEMCGSTLRGVSAPVASTGPRS